MTEYYIPTQASETEFVEKRSRFIGHVWRVESEAEARARIEEMKKRYYDARRPHRGDEKAVLRRPAQLLVLPPA